MNNKAVFSGDLSFTDLTEIFQILGGNNSTGILSMMSDYSQNRGVIYFMNGNPINATIGSLRGIDAIYALFGWSEGEFEFHKEEVKVERVVNNNRMEIVLNALKMLDDGVIKKIGPPSCDKVSGVQGSKCRLGRSESFPIIKGPLVDYTYVIEEKVFHDGERIVKEKGHGSWIWVILEGMVNIVRETPDGPVTIVRLGEGSFIGNFTSLLFTEYTRSATVTAVGDVHLGLLDTLRLSGEYTSLSSDFRRLLFSVCRRLEKITDRAIKLSKKGQKMDGWISDGDQISKKDFSEKELFTITEGETYIVERNPKGYLPLLTLEKEDVFGYVPFMDMGHEPNRAAVLASKDLAISEIDTSGLQKEYNQLSGTFKNLIENISTSVSVTTRIACDFN